MRVFAIEKAYLGKNRSTFRSSGKFLNYTCSELAQFRCSSARLLPILKLCTCKNGTWLFTGTKRLDGRSEPRKRDCPGQNGTSGHPRLGWHPWMSLLTMSLGTWTRCKWWSSGCTATSRSLWQGRETEMVMEAEGKNGHVFQILVHVKDPWLVEINRG